MIEKPDLKTVRVNLDSNGNRLNLAVTLVQKAFQALFTGKTFIRIKTDLNFKQKPS